MDAQVECRILTLLDDVGNVVCDNIPQPTRDDISTFVTYQNRLFHVIGSAPREDGREGYVYSELPTLRAGTFTIEPDTYGIEGVGLQEIVDAITPPTETEEYQ